MYTRSTCIYTHAYIKTYYSYIYTAKKMPKRNFKTYPKRHNIASEDQNDALWWAAAEGQLKLVEGALKKGWSLKRDPFDPEKDDPYAGIEYQRDWSDPNYEHFPQETYGSTALHRAAIFDNGENTEKILELIKTNIENRCKGFQITQNPPLNFSRNLLKLQIYLDREKG